MKLAVSACLLGEKVRYDGGHKRDEFVVEHIAKYADFIPFCPESIAFGTPRESLRLVKDSLGVRVVSNKSGNDLTEALKVASKEELSKIYQNSIGGIIFKSRSPSCGMGSAKTYLKNGYIEGKSDGIFVKMCRESFPLLPMEEEGRLQDAWLRENFIMQLFCYDAIERFKVDEPNMSKLVNFHASYKFLLQSKDEKLYRELGNAVANHDKLPFSYILKLYEHRFKLAISKKSSIKKCRNVLQHMAGFFKKDLLEIEKKVLHEQIEDFANKLVPIIVPLSTIRLYAQKYETKYLLDQVFLDPYPRELALRSDLLSYK
jgi:uncharacterized protein YbbK (DUF523 family)/uncharacterized protein YbgA (DUF1722 family)